MPFPEGVRRVPFRLYHFLWTALDVVYPPVCAGCDQFGERWCASCEQAVRKVQEPLCSRCGRTWSGSGLCSVCHQRLPSFDGLRSWGIFEDGPLRNAIHRLKYSGDLGVGEALTHPLIEMLSVLNWQVDYVTAVPLSRERLAQRGYNQAAFLAFPLAIAMNLPYQKQALDKIRETRSQVGLSITERRDNVKDAFQARDALVRGRGVLVVDDVTTSGATMEACAFALKAAGARSVYGLTLARAG